MTMRRVFVLTVTEQPIGASVEGVYATAQAAADSVASDYDDDSDRFMQDARDLDSWDEQDPDTISYNNLYIGPGTTWAIRRMEVEGELGDQGWHQPRGRDTSPVRQDRETSIDLDVCPCCGCNPCLREGQPDSCARCGHDVEEGPNGVIRTIDLDPGCAETGPQPDIQECLVHVTCPKGPKAWEDHGYCEACGGSGTTYSPDEGTESCWRCRG